MSEYYKFLHIGFMDFSAKFMGTFFALAETVLGAAMITGVWRRIIAKCAIGLQTFFTVLTLFLVIYNPKMDCGCFGEAIHLTHMQTFVKNLILLALILAYMLPLRDLGETKKISYVSFSLISVSVLAFTVYSWLYIPLIDFTAYKPGAKLAVRASLGYDTEDVDEIFEGRYIYEKDGIRQTFTLDNIPDSTWTFVSEETIQKKEINTIGLSFQNPQTEEYMDHLAAVGKVMVISVYDTDMNEKKWGQIEAFMQRAQDTGFTPLLLCSSSDGIPANLKDKAYISSDRKTLLTMNRSNGGITYFCDGILICKWARIGAPDLDELQEIYADDTTEVSIDRESKGSLAFQGFLLYVSAVMLLL